MIKALKFIAKSIDTLNEGIGRIVSWFTTILVLLVVVDVIGRYVFNVSYAAVLELEWYLFSMIFLLAAGYTLKHDKHVRVDVFYTRFSTKTKAIINIFGALCFLIPFCVVAIYGSYKYTMVSWGYQEGSPDPGGLPARYLIKGVMVLGFSLLLLQAISSLFHNLLFLFGQANPTQLEAENQ